MLVLLALLLYGFGTAHATTHLGPHLEDAAGTVVSAPCALCVTSQPPLSLAIVVTDPTPPIDPARPAFEAKSTLPRANPGWMPLARAPPTATRPALSTH